MIEERKNIKSSWPKVVVRKWLNRKSSGDEFHSDYTLFQRRRKSCSDGGRYVVVPEELSICFNSEEWPMEKNTDIEGPGFNQLACFIPNNLNLRMFVGTWNVGGKSPSNEPNAPADIYVLGFQEIVPLNAGNVLGLKIRDPQTGGYR